MVMTTRCSRVRRSVRFATTSVAKAEPSQVVRGELPANADGRSAVQRGSDEVAHDTRHRLEARRVAVDRPVGSHPEDRNGYREPPKELRGLDQPRFVARPERVRERDHVRVEALVDLLGSRGLDAQAVRLHVHARGGKDLLGRPKEDEVAAVAGDEVPADRLLRAVDLECVLRGPKQDAAGHSRYAIRA
jgi:hypothetical protein